MYSPAEIHTKGTLIQMTQEPKSPIGVYDSGVGGLTVLRRLRALLPGEDIIYFGDSANCPFGNRSRQELGAITRRIFDFFRSREVKLTVSACNTTSALFQMEGEPDCGFKVLSIIEPIARQLAALNLEEVGIIATEFTVGSGMYEKLIRQESPGTRVWGQGSATLASLVDACRFEGGEIPAEVARLTGELLARRPLRHIILACTHYPIVEEEFRRAAPGVTFLDPAAAQAQAAAQLLAGQGLLSPQTGGRLEVYTSGHPALFEEVAGRLGIEGIGKVERLAL